MTKPRKAEGEHARRARHLEGMIKPRRVDGKLRRQEESARLEEAKISDRDAVWRVAEDGYQWLEVTGQDKQGAVSTCRVITAIEKARGGHSTVNYREYAPLAEPGIFLKISELEQNEGAVLEFVNEHGLLGVGQLEFPLDTDETKIYGLFGEPLRVWQEAIRDLKRAVEWWNSVVNGDIAEVEARLKPEWNSGDCWVITDPGWGSFYDQSRSAPSQDGFKRLRLPGLAKNKTTDAVRRLVQLWTNRHLAEHCKILLVWSEASHQFITKVMPTNLLGCAWWQFARVVTGEIKYVFCKVCKGPIEISQDGRQQNAIFCSAACKMKDQRAREREVNQQFDSGLSPAAIAKKMGMNESTIQNWLNKREN